MSDSRSDSTPSFGHRFAALDALRGIAVIAVIALHSSYSGQERNVPLFDDYLWPFVRHGYLGVQLFFVISGYCILGAMDSALRGRTPFLTYVRRRVRRIYPPYWISILLALGLGFVTVVVTKRPWGLVFPLTGLDWLLNIALLQGPFAAPDAVLVYWSLSIEIQFYALMAACLLFPRWRSAWLIGLSTAYAIWAWRPFMPLSGTPLGYWPEFACGIGAYAAHHPTGAIRGTHWWLWGLSAVAILLGFTHLTTLAAADGEFATPIKQLFCLACGILIWQLRAFDFAFERNRILRLLGYFGTLSYSLYLTHVPIGTRVFNLAERASLLYGLAWYAVALTAVVVQLAAGWLFYKYCESPFLNKKIT